MRKDCPIYHPNDTLAAVLVQAWLDKGFRNQLLSKPDLTNQPSTKALLEKFGIFLDKPVVLEENEYAAYKPNPGETVFTIPTAMGRPTMETARIAMASTCAGI